MAETYILAALCWGIAGIFNGFTGFGLALIAMPLFTQFVDMVYAVPACTLISLSVTGQMGWTYRKSVDWNRLRPLIIGALPGAIAGATALKHMPETGIKLGMGVFLLAYSLWSLFYQQKELKPVSAKWGYVAGMCSTAIGTSIGMGGPPTIVYTTLAGWSKDTIKAGIAFFFLSAGSIMIGVQLIYGLQSVQSLVFFLICAPSVAIGCRVGIVLSRRLGEGSYKTMMFVTLTIMAVMIIYKALV